MNLMSKRNKTLLSAGGLGGLAVLLFLVGEDSVAVIAILMALGCLVVAATPGQPQQQSKLQ